MPRHDEAAAAKNLRRDFAAEHLKVGAFAESWRQRVLPNAQKECFQGVIGSIYSICPGFSISLGVVIQ